MDIWEVLLSLLPNYPIKSKRAVVGDHVKRSTQAQNGNGDTLDTMKSILGSNQAQTGRLMMYRFCFQLNTHSLESTVYSSESANSARPAFELRYSFL